MGGWPDLKLDLSGLAGNHIESGVEAKMVIVWRCNMEEDALVEEI